jgi:hypothetical protein
LLNAIEGSPKQPIGQSEIIDRATETVKAELSSTDFKDKSFTGTLSSTSESFKSVLSPALTLKKLKAESTLKQPLGLIVEPAKAFIFHPNVPLIKSSYGI